MFSSCGVLQGIWAAGTELAAVPLQIVWVLLTDVTGTCLLRSSSASKIELTLSSIPAVMPACRQQPIHQLPLPAPANHAAMRASHAMQR
jgi:hypothetical protein